MTDENQTTVGQMLYYARRAGYLEGALWVIAQGLSDVDPKVAAQRALDAVGEDMVINGKTKDRIFLSESDHPDD